MPEAPGARRLVTILSIDGGGMRGVVAGTVLAHVEEVTGRRIAELFDLVAGTSTGGILALGLTRPAERGSAAPRFSAAELVDLYRRHGPRIFGGILPRRLRGLTQLLGPKYGAGALEDTLREYLGETRLHEALTRVMVTSYDTAKGSPYFFKSWRAARADFAGRAAWHEEDFLLWEAARATSAAPTYFPPFQLAPLSSADAARVLLDGGVFANHPGVCALAEAYRLFPPAAHDYLLLSVGTGYVQRTLTFAQIVNRGTLAWAGPLLEIVFDGVSDAADYQLDELLPDGDFVRIQSDTVDVPLDDARPAAIERLDAAAAALVDRERRRLDAVCARLVDPALRARRVGPPARTPPAPAGSAPVA